VNTRVAGPGDVVTQEQGLSIVDKHEPAIAMPLSTVSLFRHMVDTQYENQIFLVGRHRVIREYVDSIHLAYTTSRQLVIVGCHATKDIR
jgi:hypothetical protein